MSITAFIVAVLLLVCFLPFLVAGFLCRLVVEGFIIGWKAFADLVIWCGLAKEEK